MSETIVYLAGVDWDAVKGTDRHLVERIGRRHPVLWVDPPLSAAHAVRRGERRRLVRPVEATPVAEGVTRLSVLVTPFPERPVVARLTALWMRLAVRVVLRRRRSVARAVIGSSPFAGLRTAPRPTGRRVYYATDDFVAGAELLGHGAGRLDRAERARIAEADVVVAVSPEILTRHDAGPAGTVLPNGCDAEGFAAVDTAPEPADVRLAAPVAGVVGQLSPRIDLGLLEAVADSGMSLLLVGPATPDIDGERFAALVARDDVAWVGPQPFDRLPSYLRLVDVGLTPYADTAFNRASFPLKTLEYLAAGRPVVSTPLPAVAALGTDLVRIAADPVAFAAAAADEAARDTAARRAERRAFAAGHSWEDRAETMLAVALGTTAPGSTTAPGATTAGTTDPDRAAPVGGSAAAG